ncbi:hypothetical protein HGRIS_009391 [Hohenbuehelia grisea]|uniref:Uncharacterized protein n=1 Tax=Hohenbuehelia grisea TaxID=104357 RepID=A0ABR3J2E3_9AGAR
MRRSGPLQELPLELYVHSDPTTSTNSKLTRSHKRPLSPGAPNLFSPAKRRILAEEGILCPDKTAKSPLSLSSRRIASAAAFADALRGPGSPARKLDFGTPKNNRECHSTQLAQEPLFASPTKTPTRSTHHTLAPSPELTPKSRSNSLPPSDSDVSEMDINASDLPPHSPPRIFRIPLMVPREMPPPPDPQSVHYPGFDVYVDTHLSLPHARDAPREADSARQPDAEWYKENMPPRRKVKKLATAPLPSTTSSRDMKVDMDKLLRAKSTPATPKVSSSGVLASPTPRRRDLNMAMDVVSSPLNSGQRKELKRAMLEEDEAAIVDDDDDMFIV